MIVAAGTKVKLTRNNAGFGNVSCLKQMGVWPDNENEIYGEAIWDFNYPGGYANIAFPNGATLSLFSKRLLILNNQEQDSARPIKGHKLTSMFRQN